MKGLHYSKAVKDGCLVQLRGNKICRASKRTKNPLGVFKISAQRVFLVIDKDKFNHSYTTTPMGIQTKGPCLCLRGK